MSTINDTIYRLGVDSRYSPTRGENGFGDSTDTFYAKLQKLWFQIYCSSLNRAIFAGKTLDFGPILDTTKIGKIRPIFAQCVHHLQTVELEHRQNCSLKLCFSFGNFHNFCKKDMVFCQRNVNYFLHVLREVLQTLCICNYLIKKEKFKCCVLLLLAKCRDGEHVSFFFVKFEALHRIQRFFWQDSLKNSALI